MAEDRMVAFLSEQTPEVAQKLAIEFLKHGILQTVPHCTKGVPKRRHGHGHDERLRDTKNERPGHKNAQPPPAPAKTLGTAHEEPSKPKHK